MYPVSAVLTAVSTKPSRPPIVWKKNSVGVKPVKKLFSTKPLASGVLAKGKLIFLCTIQTVAELTVMFEMWQRPVFEPVWYSFAVQSLLPHAGDHLRDVNEGAFGPRQRHGERTVRGVQLRQTRLTCVLADNRQLLEDDGFEGLLHGATWLGREATFCHLADVSVALRVPESFRLVFVRVGTVEPTPRPASSVFSATSSGWE
jgi:hypothetical protein